MRRLLLRSFALLATILTACTLAAVPASAHGDLVDGSPGPGDDVAVGTTVLRLEFTALDTGGTPLVAMRGPSGDLLPVGEATYGEKGTVCALTAPLEAGVHELTYSVISDDGDRQTGTYSFEVSETGAPSDPGACASPALEEPGPEDAQTIEQKSSGTLPTGVLYGLGGLAVLVGGLLVLRIRSDRRRHPAA